MFNKVMKKQEQNQIKAQNAEAMRRAEKIDAFGDKILPMAVEADLSVNDLKVVMNSLIQQLQLVFDSRPVKEFMPKDVSHETPETT